MNRNDNDHSIFEHELKNQVEKYFDFICNAIGFSVKEESRKADELGPKKLNIGMYDTHKSLIQINNFMVQEKWWMALHILQGTIKDVVCILKDQDVNWLIENSDKLILSLQYMKESEVLYNNWLSTEYQDFLNTFKTHNIFTAEELNFKDLNPHFFIELESSIDENLLKSFKYNGNGNVDISEKQFKFTEQIYLTDSLQEFMNYLKRFNKNDDIVYVNFLMKIEKRVDMSYFILTFTYKEHTWLVTDMGFDFKNPRNKETARNPRRRREKYYDNLAFPYIYIDQLEEIRKTNKQLTKFDDDISIELYIKQVKELNAYSKMFILYVISHFMKKLGTEDKKLLTFEDHLNQKLLTSADITVDHKDAEGFYLWEDDIISVSEEAIHEIDETNTSLVTVNRDVIISDLFYDRDWLGTPEQLDNIIKWTVFNSKAKVLQDQLDALEKYKDESTIELNKLLNAPGNLERLIPYMFSAEKTIYYELKDGIIFDNSNGYPDKEIKNNKLLRLKIDREQSRIIFIKFRLGFSIEEQEQKYEIWRNSTYIWRKTQNYDNYLWKQKCQCCNKVNGSKQFYLEIDHHEQLMFLCNVETKEQLPKYFRSLRSHQCVPYHGNSILDNIHPYALLKHPVWENYKNSLNIEVIMCKTCANRMYKNHLISIDTMIDTDKNVKPYVEDETTPGNKGIII